MEREKELTPNGVSLLFLFKKEGGGILSPATSF